MAADETGARSTSRLHRRRAVLNLRAFGHGGPPSAAAGETPVEPKSGDLPAPSASQHQTNSHVADPGGDGDLDILNKPYTWDAPRVDVWLNGDTGPRRQAPIGKSSKASFATQPK